MGGERYSHTGGGVNYLCLPHNPKYDRYSDGNEDQGYIYGTEYEVSSVGILSDEISMIMRRLVLSAMSNHVVQCWWCPHEKIVHLDGPKSIMGIWWLLITVTKTKKTSSVLTKTQSMFLGPIRIWTVLCCTTLKGNVALFHAFHMFSIESWHARCAQSESECCTNLM